MLKFFLPKLPIVHIHVCDRVPHGYTQTIYLLDGLRKVMAEIDITRNNVEGVVSTLRGDVVVYYNPATGSKDVLPIFYSMPDDAWLIQDHGTLITAGKVRDLIAENKPNS